MKPTNTLFLMVIFNLFSFTGLKAQDQSGVDSTGLPGDNFSLQGALEMFQKASSPEEFEKMLNSEDNHVNNLDLNGDGDIDYIRVIDNSKDNAHAFVLQDAVSENESQDIAVIELEKKGDESATLQIVGDEDIYGEEVIAEPSGNESSFNDYDFNNGYAARGPNAGNIQEANGIIVNVWFWPCVRFAYAPGYVIWHSPWKWRHYPVWWHPWRPFAWHVWHPFHYNYARHFAIVPVHRVMVAHRIYTPIRTTSVTVRKHNATAVNHYRVTRTRTTITGPRGNKAVKTTTRVKGSRGNTRVKSTKVRVHRKH
jgi:hypothetical protein